MRLNHAIAALLTIAVAPLSSHASPDDLTRDIKQLASAPLSKGSLETTAEFGARVDQLFSEYTGKVYRVQLSTTTYPRMDDKWLRYNPDTEELTVSLPSLEKQLLWTGPNGMKIGFLTFSYVPTQQPSIKGDTYVGRNGLGQEVRVERQVVDTFGLAVLTPSNKDMIPQRFIKKLPRERVPDLMARGTITLEVRTDLHRAEKEPSIFIVKKESQKPTMTSPVDLIHTKYMLPVRLVSITLQDERGTSILEATGTEQRSIALEVR